MLSVGDVITVRLHYYKGDIKTKDYSDAICLVTQVELTDEISKFSLTELKSGMSPWLLFDSVEEIENKLNKCDIPILKISKANYS